MADARVVEVAEAVVARITDGWPDPPPATVSDEFIVVTKLEAITGRNVWVFPAGFAIEGPATRSENNDDNTVAIVMAERYDPAGPPPKAWIRERVNWFEKAVWAAVTNPRVPLLVGDKPLWPQFSDASMPDPDLLRQKVFWVEASVTFREVAAPVARSF